MEPNQNLNQANFQANFMDRITYNPNQCGGRPCIRGMRIRVNDVLEMLAGGATEQEILQDYPDLEAEDIRASLEYAATRINHATAITIKDTTQRPGESEANQASEWLATAWSTARNVAQMLRQEYGATRVVVFGSLAHRAWFSSRSDIDLAVWGIPANRYYRAVAAATGFSRDFEIDLIDPSDCRPMLRQAIEGEGIDL